MKKMKKRLSIKYISFSNIILKKNENIPPRKKKPHTQFQFLLF